MSTLLSESLVKYIASISPSLSWNIIQRYMPVVCTVSGLLEKALQAFWLDELIKSARTLWWQYSPDYNYAEKAYRFLSSVNSSECQTRVLAYDLTQNYFKIAESCIRRKVLSCFWNQIYHFIPCSIAFYAVWLLIFLICVIPVFWWFQWVQVEEEVDQMRRLSVPGQRLVTPEAWPLYSPTPGKISLTQ